MQMKNKLWGLGMLVSGVAYFSLMAVSAKVPEVADGKITVYSSVANAGTGTASFSFTGLPAHILYYELSQVVPTEQKGENGSIIFIKKGANLSCVREVRPSTVPQYQCSAAVFPDGTIGEDEP